MHAPRDATLACALDGYTDLPPGKLANVVTYLEMRAPPPRPVTPRPDLALVATDTRLEPYRALFRRIGARWLWMGRLALSDAALAAALRDPRLVSRTLMRGGEGIGLVELFFDGDEAELAYCGVVPEAIGTGAGRFLLDAAIAQAFARPIARLTVHTCTLDHPGAVAFYVRSGFAPWKRAIEIHDDPRLAGLLPREAGDARWPLVES
jgi:GNAT superfamily N-acetyltransferase